MSEANDRAGSAETWRGPGAAAPSRPRRALARHLLPWVVAVGLLAWVLRKQSWSALVAAFHQAPLGPFLAASVVLLIANCAADTLAMYFTFGWFGCRLRYRELFVVRAATYLLAVVQYYVGQAAIVAYLYRRGVNVLRASGFILFISGINLAVLVLFASAGLASDRVPQPWLRYIPGAVGAGAILYGAVLQIRPAPLVRMRLLAPLFEMGVVGHLKSTLVRIPHVLVLIVWHYMALRMFGVAVTPLRALVYLPAVFFLAALPISVQGLGMSQAAATLFFATPGDPTSGARVIAYTFAMTGMSLLTQLTMGFAFLPAARRLGLSAAAPVEHVEPSAAGEVAGPSL